MNAGVSTRGRLLDWGWRYDLLVQAIDVLLGGRLRALRAQVLDLAQLSAGARLLDVGCGTGTLALQAWPRVQPGGRVVGIDPAPRQLARARRRAARRAFGVEFELAVIERLPFEDASFDAVASTWMMHHLPDDLKAAGLREIARVLKPGGRLVVLDAQHDHAHGWHMGHPRMGVGDMGAEVQPAMLRAAGFSDVQMRRVRLAPLLGVASAALIVGTREARSAPDADRERQPAGEEREPAERSDRPEPRHA